jgi:acyl-CoA dehydrogenase
VQEQVELGEFRKRVRAWLEANARSRRSAGTAPVTGEVGFLSTEDHAAVANEAKDFQRRLYEGGLAALRWPTAYGGQGLGIQEQLAFNQEADDFVLPIYVLSVGFGQAGPAILGFGSPGQKERFIPAIVRGDDLWCQLFSEPEAGSDLAGLRTTAVADGDQFVVNGQKVWTSFAQYADWGLLLARTDPAAPKHHGLSMFALDMRSPGVEVRPLRQISGGSSFNEVFFSDVRIPAAHLIGERNAGWAVAKGVLASERVVRVLGVVQSETEESLEQLLALARSRKLAGDPIVRQRLVELWSRQRIANLLSERVVAAVLAGREPGPEGSISMLVGTDLRRREAELSADLAGPPGMAWPEDEPEADLWAQRLLTSRAAGIAGGTSQIQRNIVAEHVLGLPREPMPGSAT